MQISLEPEEAWSIMTLVVSQVLDQVELSDDGKNAIRRWRSDRNEGTAEVSDLAVLLNETLGTVLDEKTLLFLGDFDGEFAELMTDLAKAAGPVFDAIFEHVENPPPTPKIKIATSSDQK